MNNKGHIILLLLGGIIFVALIPVVISWAFWPAKILMQIIMIFAIYSSVRGLIGQGTLPIVVSAILIYFMVFKYFELFLSLFILQILLGMGFVSAIMWATATLGRKH